MADSDDIWSDDWQTWEDDMGGLFSESGYTDVLGDPLGFEAHKNAREAYRMKLSHEFEQWQKTQILGEINREAIMLSFMEFMGSAEASGELEHGTSNLANADQYFEKVMRREGVDKAAELLDEYIDYISNLGFHYAPDMVAQVKQIGLDFVKDVSDVAMQEGPWMGAGLQMWEVKKLLKNTFKGKTLFSKADAEAVRQLIFKRTVMEQIQNTINDLLEEKFRRFEQVLDTKFDDTIQYYQTLLNLGHTFETSSRFVRLNIDRQVAGVKKFLHQERVVDRDVVDLYTSGLMEQMSGLIARSRTLLEKIDNELLIGFANIEALLIGLNARVENNTLGTFEVSGEDDAVLLETLGRAQALLTEVRAFSKEVYSIINTSRKTGLRTASYSRGSGEFTTGEFAGTELGGFKRGVGLTEWTQWSEGSERSGGMWAEDMSVMGGAITRESTPTSGISGTWEGGLLFSLVAIDLEKVIEQTNAFINRATTPRINNPDINAIQKFMSEKASGGIEIRMRTVNSYFTARAEVGSKNEMRYLFGISDSLVKDLKALQVSTPIINDIVMAVDGVVFGRPNLEVEIADLVEERILSKFKGFL